MPLSFKSVEVKEVECNLKLHNLVGKYAHEIGSSLISITGWSLYLKMLNKV